MCVAGAHMVPLVVQEALKRYEQAVIRADAKLRSVTFKTQRDREAMGRTAAAAAALVSELDTARKRLDGLAQVTYDHNQELLLAQARRSTSLKLAERYEADAARFPETMETVFEKHQGLLDAEGLEELLAELPVDEGSLKQVQAPKHPKYYHLLKEEIESYHDHA